MASNRPTTGTHSYSVTIEYASASRLTQSDSTLHASSSLENTSKRGIALQKSASIICNSNHGLFSQVATSNSQIGQARIDFFKKHFPSLFHGNSFIQHPAIIIKNDDRANQFESILRHLPAPDTILHFKKNGYLVTEHMGMKKCISKLLELSLEELNDATQLKETINNILEDSIELEPFNATDDLVLTSSGHTYLRKPLQASLDRQKEQKRDPNTNAPLASTKLIEDRATKRFLEELDAFVELSLNKDNLQSSRFTLLQPGRIK